MTEPTAKIAITCDDVGHARHSHPISSLKEFISILDRFEVPGTFFVIPNDGGDSPLDEDLELVSLLGKISDRGHEIAMHGYTHHILEFGPPRQFILRIDATALYLNEMSRREEEIAASHTFDAHKNKIKKGLDTLRKALNIKPVGFRAGWGSYNANMFKALSVEGFSYDSSIYKPEAAKEKPYYVADNLLELPMDLDYAWCLSREDLAPSLEKAKLAYDGSSRAGSVFVPLLHHWAMTRYERLEVTYDFTTGFELLEHMIQHLKAQGAEFVTMEEARKSVLEIA